MPERPLLLFPTPERAERSKPRGGAKKFQKPPFSRQNERISPQFTQLQAAFDARRVEIQRTAIGVDPEMVLVLETVGSLRDFAKAIKRIQGLEWLVEIEEDDILPDDDFYYPDDRNKPLNGRLYLIMTNHEALNQLHSLWGRFKENHQMKFEHGKTQFRDLFLCLHDVRVWSAKDRLEETGILEDWQENIRNNGGQKIRFQTELWYRSNLEKQRSIEQVVSALIQGLGGRVISSCIFPEIAYHSLLAELPAYAIQEIIDNPHTALVECDGIMFFRPVGQMSVGKGTTLGDLSDYTSDVELELPTDDPIIAVLDGLPLANHQLLLNRLIIDDPDDWASTYTTTDRYHGTGMASLIVHGDLDKGTRPLPCRVYIRPILKPDPQDPVHDEIVPEENELAVDLFHRAIHRIVDSDGEEAAVAPTVKIINLSYGDPTRQFTQAMSPLARLLDWLSFRYNLLFIISAGNHFKPITMELKRTEFEGLSLTELEKKVIKALYADSRNRKIFSPAESINALTIGALHDDWATITPQDVRINPFECALPCPYSSFGGGYRRAIKPEIVYPGGRLFYERGVGEVDNIILECSFIRNAPGIRVASPGILAGELNKTIYCHGTSNSTALISRSAVMYYYSLIEILENQVHEIDYQPYVVPLLKAMVVHGCAWGGAGSRLKSVLQSEGNNHQIKNWISQWLGYGSLDVSKVIECTEQRATLLGFGQLNDGEAHVFSLPLPPSLGGRREKRKLTVTLAWLSPTAARTQKYRVASLWFELDTSLLGVSRTDTEWVAAKRGTVQHEVFEGEQALPLTEGDTLTIKVNCRQDATKIETPIRYGIVASLEVAEGVDIAVYNEVRTRIAPAVMIRPDEIF